LTFKTNSQFYFDNAIIKLYVETSVSKYLLEDWTFESVVS